MHRITQITALFLCLIPFTTSMAARLDSYPLRHIDAVRAQNPPNIDAVLDDELWNSASTVTKFCDRRTDGYSKQNTIARIAYDDKYIYVAFECFEDPKTIVTAERKYDRTRLFSDDLVQVTFDTFHDQEGAYIFTVNPLGTKMDARRGIFGFNIAWNADWQAAAKILGNLIRFKQIQFNSRPADDSAQKILLQCKKELNIRRSVRLLENGFFPEY